MKLKYNLIAWSLLGFFAAACDPMDDIYNEIDAETVNPVAFSCAILAYRRRYFGKLISTAMTSAASR